MRRVALRGLAWRKVRGVLTGLAIVLGVAMVSGSFVLTDTMKKAADNLKSESYAGIDGVVSAEDVTGPYDVIARAEASSVDELGKMVVSRVQMIDGITRTLTCPVVHL